MKTILVTAALFASLVATPTFAAGADFLSNLSGKWAGSGSAYLRGLGNIGASCDMKAVGPEDSVKLNGRCGVLIWKIPLGISLKHQGGNKFSGVYTGSKTGPARLSGTLSGNKLTMDITWGGEVNGDRKAVMVLTRTGPNAFSQVVRDEVGGKLRTTSQFKFKRS